MHDSQRRALLRALFVLTCLVPTIAVAAWIYALRTDAYRASWERSLGEALGMRVACDAVGLPTPGVVLFAGLRCYDPETDAVVLQCSRLEGQAVADGLVLHVPDCEVFAEQGAKLFTAVERRLKREVPEVGVRISGKADRLTWHTSAGSQTLEDFEVLLEPSDAGRQLLVNFHPAGATIDEPASMRLARNSAANPPETVVELDGGAGSLPCSMLAPLTPIAASFGPSAQWSGRLKLKHAARGWEGMLSGGLTSVDLQTLLGRDVQLPVWGGGDVTIHWAEFAAGRLVRLRGSVEAGPGQVGREFVAAGVAHLGLGDPRAELPPEPALVFDRLEFDFSFDAGGLALRPRNAAKQDALLWRGDVAYWRAPSVNEQPLANLLRAVGPQSDRLVPLGPSVAKLIDVLPLEATTDVKPTVLEAKQPAMPQPRLRLRGPVPDGTQLR